MSSAQPAEPPAATAPRHPLGPGASPAAIRAALLPSDRPAFDAAYGAALDEARARLDLSGLLETVETWRRLAALQANPATFTRVTRRVAELRTGQPVPADEPLSVSRHKAGL